MNLRSCYIIGTSTLVIQCADIILENNYEVKGVISNDMQIADWALTKQIPFFTTDNLEDILKREPFDYLFSIVNHVVLSKDIINLAREMAVNYHDAPLPKYAGMNATTWALIERVSSYGISWHVMTDTIDGGDILKQPIFSVSLDETSLTLNAKCYEAAINSFSELIDELTANNITRKKQIAIDRTYFSRYKRPDNHAIISWHSEIEAIDALVRSLNFGTYVNPIALPKVFIGKEIFYVLEVSIDHHREVMPIGTIKNITQDGICVVSKNGNVLLRKIMNTCGELIGSIDLKLLFDLKTGEELSNSTDKEQLDIIVDVDIIRQEPYWVSKLSTLNPIDMPCQEEKELDTLDVDAKVLTANIEGHLISGLNDFLKIHHVEERQFFCSSFILFLARLNGKYSFDLAYSDIDIRYEDEHFKTIYSTQTPLHMDLSPEETVRCNVEKIMSVMSTLKSKDGFLKDVFLRYPQLNKLVNSRFYCNLPMAIEFLNNNEYEHSRDSLKNKLVFSCNINKRKYTLLSNKSCFSEDLFSKIKSQFVVFSENLIKNYLCKLSSVQVLSLEQSSEMLYKWNNTEKIYFPEKTVINLFEEHVRENPNAAAAIYNGISLTYQDLNNKANQVARYIQKQYQTLCNKKFVADTLVPICFHRNHEMIIAILGVMKAGGAYVPIDPDAPNERIRFIVEDTKSEFILTQTNLLVNLEDVGKDVYLINIDDKEYEGENFCHLERQAAPNNFSYVIYTSGTTGKPKGVINIHSALLNRLEWMKETYKVDHSAKVLQKTPYVFDVSIWEIILPLMSGACLILMKQNEHKFPEKIHKAIVDMEISHISFVPSMLDGYLEYITANKISDGFKNLKAIFSEGEALSIAIYNKLRSVNNYLSIHNLYGPTEAAIEVSSYECIGHLEEILIGKPISNLKLYVLNADLTPMPIGFIGEIYIGGVGLARGYMNNPALTSEKFIDNPFITEKDKFTGFTKLYKTGDIGLWRDDGNLFYIGRNDFQIKLRGFRIELCEIENVMAQYKNIKQSAVACKGKEGHQYLVAYYVSKEKLDNDAIHEYLKQKLPEYMLPSIYIHLESLPLSSNGKLDRMALPEVQFDVQDVYIEPQNDIEREMCTIWSSVLNIKNIGVSHNFFKMGGDSLLAIKIVSKMRAIFNIDLSIKDLFECQNIQKIAEKMNSSVYGKITKEVSIKRTSGQESVILSYPQQRLWFLAQLKQRSAFYNLMQNWSIVGDIDYNAFTLAINEIIRRHSILNTNYDSKNGTPYKVINVNRPVVINHYNNSNVTIDIVKKVIEKEATEPFDLALDPLFRIYIFDLTDNEIVLSLVMHHIISDGWSFDVFNKELNTLYSKYKNDQNKSAPILNVTYDDYIVWQMSTEKNKKFYEKINYWKQKLCNLQPVELATDYARPPIQSNTGETITFSIGEVLSHSLKLLAVKKEITMFTLMISTVDVLLYRYTQQSDIVMGVPFSGRTIPELDSLIGFFVNTVLIRSKLNINLSFCNLLGENHKNFMEAYANQDVPFERLVDILQPERDLSRSPLFQIMFVFQNAGMKKLELEGLNTERIDIDTKTSKFDLTFFVEEHEKELIGKIEYNTDLFKRETIERMTRHWLELLNNVVDNPELPVKELKVITAAELEEQKHWNETQEEFSSYLLQELFLERAKLKPQAIAVITPSRTLSYGDLARQANRVGNRLHKMQVKADELVAVVMEKGWEQIVAVLGILNAGGAYLPIDVNEPTIRLTKVLSCGKARIILTQSQYLSRIDWPAEVTALAIDDEQEWIGYSEDPMGVMAKEDDLAYVIFTSGSTGEPKGVAISHRSAMNTIQDVNKKFNVREKDRVLGLSALHFDLSVYDIFGVLGVGGTLILPAAQDIKDPGVWLRLIMETSITIWDTVPPLFQMLVNYILELKDVETIKEQVKSLRLALLSGDWLPINLPIQAKDIFKNIEVISLGGATEASIWSIFYPIKAVKANWKSIPYGKPMANQQFYILDNDMQAMPIGFVGDLWIGGVGVAREYWSDVERTQASFTIHPQNKKRIYRTGDKGRYWADGTIEFLGRMDQQIKLNGLRIELGEVEAKLNEYHKIKQSIVLIQKDENNEDYLVAYVVAEEEIDLDDLANFVQDRLPQYMLPSGYFQLLEVPLTQNGKLDKKSLPKVERRKQLGKEYVAPRTEIEERVEKIWEEVLRLEKISVVDNFFALGGHSLRATQVISRIRGQFGLEFPLRFLFEFPTIEEISQKIILLDWVQNKQKHHINAEESFIEEGVI